MKKLSSRQQNKLSAVWSAVFFALLLGGAATALVLYLFSLSGLQLPLLVGLPLLLILFFTPTATLIVFLVRRSGVEMQWVTLFVVPWSFFLAGLLVGALAFCLSAVGVPTEGTAGDIVFSALFLIIGSAFSARRILQRDFGAEEISGDSNSSSWST